MNIRFLDEAQTELDETIDYYNSELPGLGKQFLSEVLLSMERIVSFPEAWQQLSVNTRRCQTRRFPYGLVYSVLKDEILIISVSNLHREPNHWKERLGRT